MKAMYTDTRGIMYIMLRVERAAGPSCWGCCFMVMKERANWARPARMGIKIRPMQAHSRWKLVNPVLGLDVRSKPRKL